MLRPLCTTEAFSSGDDLKSPGCLTESVSYFAYFGSTHLFQAFCSWTRAPAKQICDKNDRDAQSVTKLTHLTLPCLLTWFSSPWRDAFGSYMNRTPGKPRFVTLLLYLDADWPNEFDGETLFMDCATSTGVFVRPKLGRAILMDQDITHRQAVLLYRMVSS